MFSWLDGIGLVRRSSSLGVKLISESTVDASLGVAESTTTAITADNAGGHHLNRDFLDQFLGPLFIHLFLCAGHRKADTAEVIILPRLASVGGGISTRLRLG